MTTIIVVAIVALVFFVTVCVATFMVWKRETEMRTDSIRAMERTMNNMAYELAGLNVDKGRSASQYGIRPAEGSSRNRKKKKDPFDWTKRKNDIEIAEEETVTVFRPVEGEKRKLKWTEISEEKASKEGKPVAEEKPPVIEKNPEVTESGQQNAEDNGIRLSFAAMEEFELGALEDEDIDFFDNLSGVHTAYDMGRSGKKYTAEELEELIKE